MKRYKIIGLTGQSGAGKSTAARLLEENNVCVINADALTAQLYQPDSPYLKTLASVFGSDIINQDRTLNRQALAQRAVRSTESTSTLKSLVHPFVLSLFLQRAKSAALSGADIIVFDAPQLFESNADVFCDAVVSVVADRKIRLERICLRDKITEQQAIQRFNAQLSEKFFRENSDLVVENNGSAEELRKSLFAALSSFIKPIELTSGFAPS
ncbi:MAG: dephospho-CoA kinase [Clostridiales bacterium]|nr:dephospho-CoA kinase [Clostridiales bacterium]